MDILACITAASVIVTTTMLRIAVATAAVVLTARMLGVAI